MSRLIDADDFRREIDKHWPFTKEEQCKHGIADMAKSELLYVLNQMPTIEEHKKGKWLRYGEDGNPNEDDTVFWQCDQCLETYTGRTTRIPNFCPNCGADMRGEG